MAKLLACRACLATDVKLFDIHHKLRSHFEILTGTKVNPDDRMPQHLCAFCRKQLIRLVLFQKGCGRVQVFLEDTLRDGMITTEVLREIDREKHNFQRNYQISQTVVVDNFSKHNVIVKESDKSSDEEPLSKKVKRTKRKRRKTEILRETEIKKEFIIKTDDENEQFDSSFFEFDEISIKHEKGKDIQQCLGDINVEMILLTKEQQMEEIESRKHSDNYINSIYKCSECYQGFISEASFTKHMVKHDPRRGDFSCNICHVHFPNDATLRSHVRSLHERRFTCKVCSHTSKTICKAKEHHKWHNGYTYDCKICGAKFRKSTTRLTHIRLRHPSQNSCELCGESFIGENGLRMHKMKSHTEEELSVADKCTLCDMKFQNADALQRHTTITHHTKCDPGVRPCVHCGENLSNDVSLRQHIKKIHTSKQIYACDECEARFTRAGAHARHYRREHAGGAGAGEAAGGAGEAAGGVGAGGELRGRTRADSHMCEACGLTCNSRTALKSHQRTHTGEKPFHCPKCPKQFTMLQNLRIHVRTHTGERPFQCASCTKAFRHKAALNRHVRVHSGVKPYTCPHCDKSFSQSNSVKTHVRGVHLKLPQLYRHTNKVDL